MEQKKADPLIEDLPTKGRSDMVTMCQRYSLAYIPLITQKGNF